ncbi:hypothetical protein SISSUDRAFT_1034451 [Sistotremastrum suecicum HHB10207 ss-3]|uniref:Uncharacterized protein n=1 Tax=Sistotremastrum suecicum HHB10207 ss-3 TaxID=1314776 RepID=A0A166C2B6_9AGAM|nr:hypothetical protein SISSUDRAFT_1034451 [Sistotremastrum suecicum HHB10207 ss-3]
MSPEALAEKMEKMKLQNAQIKQRQQQIAADKKAFDAALEEEQRKNARRAQVQATIDQSRDVNARRKMDKIVNREWDAGKGQATRPMNLSNQARKIAEEEEEAGEEGEEEAVVMLEVLRETSRTQFQSLLKRQEAGAKRTLRTWMSESLALNLRAKSPVGAQSIQVKSPVGAQSIQVKSLAGAPRQLNVRQRSLAGAIAKELAKAVAGRTAV